MNIEQLMRDFIHLVEIGQVEIYNEFSLQHELGIYLRTKINNYKIQFERNTKFFRIYGTIKREIDIVVYNDNEKYAIELKYPLNGQYPEQMFCFVKDIKFMEEIKSQGFNATYCLTIVQNRNFYSGRKIDGIYLLFRKKGLINGVINKPTGKKDEQINIKGKYEIDWKECGDKKYYIVAIE